MKKLFCNNKGCILINPSLYIFYDYFIVSGSELSYAGVNVLRVFDTLASDCMQCAACALPRLRTWRKSRLLILRGT